MVNFVKIGLHPQSDKDIFDPSIEVYRGIFELGSKIAIGKEKYFIDNILETIYSIKIDKFSFNKTVLEENIRELQNYENPVILAPVKLLHDKMFREEMVSWDQKFGEFVFYK